jgi:hypothetical protein
MASIVIQMNLGSTISIYAGGVGSGPTAPCPSCGPHGIGQGDKVKVKEGAKITTQGGSKMSFTPGTVATVVSVLPKVGTADQMAGIISVKDQKDGKFGNMGHVKLDDLILHEKMHEEALGKLPLFTHSWFKNPQVPEYKKQDIQPAPKKSVIMQTTTHDGAKLTWVKPAEETKPSYKSMQQLSREPHDLKGKFNRIVNAPGYAPGLNEKGITRNASVYDTSRTPAEGREAKTGATVWVSTNTSKGKISGVSVREANYTYPAARTSTIQFDYQNAAKAVGMLKQRYGISTSLAKMRGGN